MLKSPHTTAGAPQAPYQCDGTGAAEALGSRPARTHCGRACCASMDDPVTLEEWQKLRASAPQ